MGKMCGTLRRRSGYSKDIRGLHADIFVPNFGTLFNEISHDLDAVLVLDDNEFYAARAQEILVTHEVDVLTDHHPRNPVQQDGARAHITGG